MNTRNVVLAAAVAIGVVEIVALFVEAWYAVVLAAIFLLLAFWFWRRNSVWPAALLALFFVLEIVYLGGYGWADGGDRLMIIVTVATSAVGALAAVVWLARSRRSRA